jgi:FkbM family methyltransferase
MKVLKILSGLKAKYFSISDKIVQSELIGVPLRVLNGTIRKEDYDDAWIYYLAKNSSVFFDLGCNIGKTSLMVSLSRNLKRIILVDPNPEAVACASKNLILNDFVSNCSFFTAFVGSRQGDRIKFYTVGVGSAGSIFASHAETARLINSFYFVNTVTLDYLSDYYNLIPDLVKIDVEGAETQVLLGAISTAQHKQTRFFIEMHVTEECTMKENGNEVLNWAKVNGYKVYYLKKGIEMVDASLIAERGRCHLLIQPKEWDYPDYLRGVSENSPLPKAL